MGSAGRSPPEGPRGTSGSAQAEGVEAPGDSAAGRRSLRTLRRARNGAARLYQRKGLCAAATPRSLGSREASQQDTRAKAVIDAGVKWRRARERLSPASDTASRKGSKPDGRDAACGSVDESPIRRSPDAPSCTELPQNGVLVSKLSAGVPARFAGPIHAERASLAADEEAKQPKW
jgi:hypothetical protein